MIAQGVEIGRPSTLHARAEGGDGLIDAVEVGGARSSSPAASSASGRRLRRLRDFAEQLRRARRRTGRWPFGVSPLTTCGTTAARTSAASSSEIPASWRARDRVLAHDRRARPARSPAALSPVPTHESAWAARPLAWAPCMIFERPPPLSTSRGAARARPRGRRCSCRRRGARPPPPARRRGARRGRPARPPAPPRRPEPPPRSPPSRSSSPPPPCPPPLAFVRLPSRSSSPLIGRSFGRGAPILPHARVSRNATAVIPGSSTASAVQNRPPSRETWRRSGVA